MMDIQPKIATLERLYIEFAKGFNESDDADIKGAIGGLKHMTTVGYFDVFKKSDLLRRNKLLRNPPQHCESACES